MRYLFFISLLWMTAFIGNTQSELNATVNFLSTDSFSLNDSLISDPVRPTMNKQGENSVGYALPWVSKKEKYKNNSLRIFPVANILGSYRSGAFSTTSMNLGAGFGVSTQLTPHFYAHLILTGNYYDYNGLNNPFYRIYRTDFIQGKQFDAVFSIQPRLRLSYSPWDFLNIQAGIDQNFIGQGERSILLSDYGAPYPFVQLRTKLWKFEISNLYQFFKEFDGQNSVHKFASTHFFNFKANENFQIGLFESVVFASKDTLMNRGYEVAYLNPLLFYRPTEYGLGSQDRLLIGLNTSYEYKNFMIYAQWAFDDFVLKELIKRTRWWANKYTGQIGIKGKHNINNKRLSWLAELNFARPFTYAHLDERTVYGNQGKPLAHPLGANYIEVFGKVGYELSKKLSLKAQLFYTQQGGFEENITINYGTDIYRPYNDRPFEHGYYLAENGRHIRFNFSTELSYAIFPKLAIEAFVRPGFETHSLIGSPYHTDFYVFGGVRSKLWNERSFGF